jgi:uncharacterized protein YjdB
MKKVIFTGLFALLLAGCSSKSQKTALDYSLQANEYKMKSTTEGITFAENGVFKSGVDLNVDHLLNLFSVNHILDPLYSRVGKDATVQASLLTPFLVSAVLSGWSFNPVSPKTGGITFTFGIIGEENGNEPAGPTAELIKSGLVNLMQLVVVDHETKEIVAFNEIIRKKGDTKAAFKMESIKFGKIYDIMLLMGHAERDYETEKENENENYVYKKNTAPTLLAVGFNKKMEITGSEKSITMIMWPLVVYTKFTTTDEIISEESRTVTPTTNDGKPETVALPPLNWTTSWTVAKSGFDYLEAANLGVKLFRADTGIVWKSDGSVDKKTLGERSGNVINVDVNDYTFGKGIGIAGSANFKLMYTPFSLDDTKWTNVRSEGAPVWIIRNGLNDLAQNDNTDFAKFSKANGDINGNGAVRFVVGAKVDAGTQPSSEPNQDLLIKDGKFKNFAEESFAANIGFATAGYSNTADVYYAVVNHTSNPTYADYTGYLGPHETGSYNKEINLAGVNANDYPDVYVLLIQDGSISAPERIWTFVPVTNITVTPETVTAGTTDTQLSGTVEPDNATNSEITWELVSPTEKGVSVTKSGYLSINLEDYTANDDVVVRATIANGEEPGKPYTQEFPINVFVPVSNITVTPATVVAGPTVTQLSGAVTPLNATNSEITWELVSPEGKGVSVSPTGSLSINLENYTGNDVVVVRATIDNGEEPGKPYTEELYLGVFVPVNKIDLTSAAKITKGQTLSLSGAVAPNNATNKTITWTLSAGSTGVTLIDNTLYATAANVQSGTVTVTASIANGTIPGEDYTKEFVITVQPTVTGVSLPASASVDVNGILSLSATIEPSGAEYQSVSWSSNNDKATVSGSDLSATVTGQAAGDATITVTVTNADGSQVTAICTVTVKAIAVTGVTLSSSTLYLKVDDESTLSATVSPDYATNKSVEWSSNNGVATVNSSGKVTGKTAGTSIITVTTADGKKTATCTVKVISISLPTTLSVNEGESKTLSPTIIPSDVGGIVTWSSNNTSVATVTSSGSVYGVRAGTTTANITVTLKINGKEFKSTCTVTVNPKAVPKVTSVTLNKTTAYIDVNGTLDLTATITGESGFEYNIRWMSERPEYATVNNTTPTSSTSTTTTARVTGANNGLGETIIYAEIKNSTQTYLPQCRVYVTKFATGIGNISWTETNTYLDGNLIAQLYCQPVPSDAECTMSWTIKSGSNVIRFKRELSTWVGNKKILEGVEYELIGMGTAVITTTVTNVDGTTKTVDHTLHVLDPALRPR